MGSFDMACGVSGISLGMGQPTRMFFIANPYPPDHLCYPTDLYTLCSFGIDMKYDDYGRYEFDDQQPAWQDFVSFIRESAECVAPGDNEYHEKEFDPNNPAHLEPDYLFDMMYHARLRLKPRAAIPHNPVVNVHPFPIHKRVFDEVCMRVSTDYTNKPLTKETCRAFIEERVKETRGRRKGMKFEHVVESFEREDYLCDHNCFYGIYPFRKAYLSRGHDWLADNCAETTMLHHFMMINRIMFVPIMSAGQDVAYEETIAFHEGCARIASELKKKFDEEMDGEFDGEEQE